MNRTIQYGIDRETGMIWSRIGSQVALPILQYDQMGPEDNFQTQYTLEIMDIIELVGSLTFIQWTRKIPLRLKNVHREFWGMKSLKK